jgi:hypothetical protein
LKIKMVRVQPQQPFITPTDWSRYRHFDRVLWTLPKINSQLIAMLSRSPPVISTLIFYFQTSTGELFTVLR